MSDPTRDIEIARALGYPYPIPARSFVFDNGDVKSFTSEDGEHLRQGRIPVLAVGSNQSPEQIARKFQGTDWLPIPCERVTLDDFDTVYSAHLTGYGSISATLHPSPGTQVNLFVNWLAESHLPRMHETELGGGNYAFARLSGIRLETEHGLKMDSVYFYRGNPGAMMMNGIPVPLAEVVASNRVWPSMPQRDIQAYVHGRTDPHLSFMDFVHSSITDADTRKRRADFIEENAEPFPTVAVQILAE